MDSNLDFLRNKIKYSIDNANNMYDLVPFLSSSLPINFIKNILKQQIEQFDYQQIRSTYYNSLCIFETLPSDLVQEILSFNNPKCIKSVNSVFKNYCDINEIKHIKQQIQIDHPSAIIEEDEINQVLLQNERLKIEQSVTRHTNQVQALTLSNLKNKAKLLDVSAKVYALRLQRNKINDSEFAVDISYDETQNKTWRVSSNYTYTYLSNSNDTFYSISAAVERCKSGDKILVRPGEYVAKYNIINIQDKNVQIIGVGGDVKITLDAIELTNSKVYFENIHFRLSAATHGDSEGCLLINENCKLWAKQCRFDFGEAAIALRNMSDLYLKECRFIGATWAGIALQISPWSGRVYIMQCIFENCGQMDCIIGRPHGAYSCVEIEAMREDETLFSEYSPFIQFKCIGNTFKNNRGYTVAIPQTRNDDRYDLFEKIDFKQLVLRDNVLKGYNGLNTITGKLNDANRVYFNTEIAYDARIRDTY